MIWGIRLEPGKIHHENVSKDVHITMAAMESWDSADNISTKSLVFLQVQQSEFLLCTLNGVLLQQHLDMKLSQGEKLIFSVRGKNSVYLTGYSEDSKMEEEGSWEENWMHEDGSEADGGDVVWRDKTESSREGQSEANSFHDEETQSEKIVPVNIKKEIEDEESIDVQPSEKINSLTQMSQHQQRTQDMFSPYAEVEDNDALNMEDTEINNQSIAGSSTIVSPSRRLAQNRNCSFSPLPVQGVQPSVSSEEASYSVEVAPLRYHFQKQFPPHAGNPCAPSAEASLTNHTAMMNKLKILQQSLNPNIFPAASNHSFLFAPPRLSSPVFSRKLASAAHVRRPNNLPAERPLFKCSFCKKSFNHKGMFEVHMESHQTKRSQSSEEFLCRYCDKVFVSRHRLKTHEHGHEGIRPYKCQICGKGFTQSGTCRRHERIHVGFKPFKCRFCTKTFLQTKDLKKHEVYHLRELMTKEASCL